MTEVYNSDTEAYKEGCAAFYERSHMCPYMEDTEECYDWWEGWSDAELEYEEDT